MTDQPRTTGERSGHPLAPETARELWAKERAKLSDNGDNLLDDPGYVASLDDGDPPEPVTLRFVTLADFAAVEEEGADPLLGDGADVLIPANGNVMVYGDGGVGKTTLSVDLGCHLAAGDDWLGIHVPHPLNLLMIENEGPRPLFRVKAAGKLAAWTGKPLDGRLSICEEPWATFTFANQAHRIELARQIAEHETDVVVIGPLTTSGMVDAGTLQDVRAFIALLDDVRRRCGRDVTFILIHHENKGGKVSGAWEGAGDTLLHVHGMGSGRTRVYVQKARWSTTWHAQTLELRWTDGQGFEVEQKPEITDDDLIEQILDAIGQHPGTGWSKVERAITGVRAERKRTVRDRLLTDRRIINIVHDDGTEVALDHCPERHRTRLHLADDPTVAHLRPDRDDFGTTKSSATGETANPKSSRRPDVRRDDFGDDSPARLDLDADG